MALFGKKPPEPRPVEQLSEELKELLAKAQDERTKLSALLGRTKGSVEKLEQLETPLRAVTEKTETIAQQIQRAEDRAAQLEQIAKRVDELNQRSAVAEQAQKTAEDRITRANSNVSDVLALAEGLKESVTAALQVRTELQAATGPGGAVAELRGKIDDLRGQFLGYSHDVTQARDQQESLKRTQEDATSRVLQLRDDASKIKDQVDEAGSQIARFDAALASLSRVQELAPRAE